mgnify:CR=1 FL=1
MVIVSRRASVAPDEAKGARSPLQNYIFFEIIPNATLNGAARSESLGRYIKKGARLDSL